MRLSYLGGNLVLDGNLSSVVSPSPTCLFRELVRLGITSLLAGSAVVVRSMDEYLFRVFVAPRLDDGGGVGVDLAGAS